MPGYDVSLDVSMYVEADDEREAEDIARSEWKMAGEVVNVQVNGLDKQWLEEEWEGARLQLAELESDG